MSRRLRTREKLTLLDPPNPQWSSFRTNCEPYSVSPAPILAPHEFSSRKHHHRNPRQICTCKIKGFNPPVMNTCEKMGVGYSPRFLFTIGSAVVVAACIPRRRVDSATRPMTVCGGIMDTIPAKESPLNDLT